MTTKPLKILLADDDADDRHFFEKALMEIPVSAHLITVHDGEQLMNYLNDVGAQNHVSLPDILFLDLSMPRKTGFECLAEIKENKQLKNIPVYVFTTSFGRDTDFEQNLTNTLTNIGAEQYVRKPSDFEELKTIIQNALIRIQKQSNNK